MFGNTPIACRLANDCANLVLGTLHMGMKYE